MILLTYYKGRDRFQVHGESVPSIDNLYLSINGEGRYPIKRYKTITSYQYQAFKPVKGHNKGYTIPRALIAAILGEDKGNGN